MDGWTGGEWMRVEESGLFWIIYKLMGYELYISHVNHVNHINQCLLRTMYGLRPELALSIFES